MSGCTRRRLVTTIFPLLLIVATLGTGYRKTDAPAPIPTDPIEANPTAAEAERAKFEGVWTHLGIGINGKQATASIAAEFVYKFVGKEYSNVRGSRTISHGTFSLDPTKTPPAIDFAESSGVAVYGIYRFEGDRLIICQRELERPTEFESLEGQSRCLVVLERQK